MNGMDNYQNPSDQEIYKILSEAKTIAVVGASPNPERTSHAIMKKLQQWGYHCIPVNPGQNEILGEKCYPDLSSIPESIDIIDVFRKPEHTPPIAQEAAKIKAKVLWLQQGISNDEAAEIAKENGLTVIQDYCIAVAHSTLHVPIKR
jgi:predicted CoA-binding protein